jgi:hypothetical protein
MRTEAFSCHLHWFPWSGVAGRTIVLSSCHNSPALWFQSFFFPLSFRCAWSRWCEFGGERKIRAGRRCNQKPASSPAACAAIVCTTRHDRTSVLQAMIVQVANFSSRLKKQLIKLSREATFMALSFLSCRRFWLYLNARIEWLHNLHCTFDHDTIQELNATISLWHSETNLCIERDYFIHMKSCYDSLGNCEMKLPLGLA